MDRTSGKDNVDIGGGRRGFQDQDAVAGIAGTRVDAAFLNSIQEEILAVIEGAGLTPDAGNWQQLLMAIKHIYDDRSGVVQGDGWIKHSDGTYEAWGQVELLEKTTVVDVTLPITFPTKIDTVLITDTNAGAYTGAGYPLDTSHFRCLVQKFVINPATGNVERKYGPIVLWYRCWGR